MQKSICYKELRLNILSYSQFWQNQVNYQSIVI